MTNKHITKCAIFFRLGALYFFFYFWPFFLRYVLALPWLASSTDNRGWERQETRTRVSQSWAWISITRSKRSKWSKYVWCANCKKDEGHRTKQKSIMVRDSSDIVAIFILLVWLIPCTSFIDQVVLCLPLICSFPWVLIYFLQLMVRGERKRETVGEGVRNK